MNTLRCVRIEYMRIEIVQCQGQISYDTHSSSAGETSVSIQV